jgi:lysophospholipase L1-like esterase
LEAALRQEYFDRHKDLKDPKDQKRKIDVLNRGIGGQEAPKELDRMQDDVIAEKPQLVIWQIGTNSVWQAPRDKPPSKAKTIDALRKGVKRLQRAGNIDIILMDLQYVPAVLTPATRAQANAMVSAIAKVASEMKVNLFRRFAFMKAWHELEGVSFDRIVDPADTDRLHDSDWSTQRLAWNLSQLIFKAVDKATA